MASKYASISQGSDYRLNKVDEFSHSNDESEYEEKNMKSKLGYCRYRLGFTDVWNIIGSIMN